MDRSVARTMWQLLEPCHAVVYFAPEARAVYTSIGLKGGWMGYFASRAAAMGPVPAEVVIGTFYNFHPAMVRRAIPDAWSFAAPQTVLGARYEVADAALARLLDGVDTDLIRAAGGLARSVTEHCDPGGRALFAAHAALEWPDQPRLALWHAATLLREFRGDGHVLALVTNGVDGCEANVLSAAAGAFAADTQRSHRGWSDDDWQLAENRLRSRRLLDEHGMLSPGGRALRKEIEDVTDDLALRPFAAVGLAECEKLEEALLPLAAEIDRRGGVPYPNPMGLTKRS